MSDNAVGLYDKFDGIFYTNNGSGTFGKGNSLLVDESTQVTVNEDHTLYAVWEEEE